MNTHHSPIAGKTMLLVNTGSTRKRFIIQKLKKLGLNLIVLNKEKNWAAAHADHWILADTTNHKESLTAIDKFLLKHPEIKFDGAITFWEDDVLLNSKIVDRYHLIGIPFDVARQARNKFMFREFCRKHDLPHPHHKLIKNKEDLKKVLEEFAFPVVVKPAYGSSSAYVVKVNDEEELRNTYQYIRKNISTTGESALSDGLDIFVEEYIDGDEVDIDMLVQNGKVKFAAVSDNAQTEEPFFIETGRTSPSVLPPENQDQLMEMAEMALEKLGVLNGCIHFEAKSTKKGAMPIECNLRMGGDEMYSSVKEVWNVDLIEEAVKIALGIYVDRIKRHTHPRKYIMSHDFLSAHSGILVKMDIDPKLKEKHYLEEINFFREIGDAVLVPPEGYEYLGWMTVKGDNMLDAQDNLKDALKYIHFEVAKFQAASSIGKTTRKNHFSIASMNQQMVLGAAKIEKIRRMTIETQRNLHIGIACNIFEETDDKEQTVEAELMSVGKNIEKTLKERGYRVSFFDFNNVPKAFDSLRNSDVDLVFNLCERINNSSLLEPHAAAMLDTLQIPYTGSNPFTLGLCIDKIRVKKLLTYHNIPTPKWDYIYGMNDSIRDDFKYPLIVKPANTDNSIGITNDSVVSDKEGLMRQLKVVIEEYKRPALIEEYIEGDEYDVSLLGSEEDDLRVLPLSRSVFTKMPKGYWHIYPYEAKWDDDSVYKKSIEVQMPPKKIDKKLASLISEIALDTYNILDCHDYGRVEIRVDSHNNPYVLELNPNPSINQGNCLPKVAELVGMNYGDFLEEIIRMCIKRYRNRPPYFHLQSGTL